MPKRKLIGDKIMSNLDIVQYLEYRIDCVQSFLRDSYALCSNDVEVIRAETELRTLLSVLDHIQAF